VRGSYSQSPEASNGGSCVQDSLWSERQSVGKFWSREARIDACRSGKIAEGIKAVLLEIMLVQSETKKNRRLILDKNAPRVV
jgi:hypothetical protein